MRINEKICRCNYCKRVMKQATYNQNPFCSECLTERLENEARNVGRGKNVTNGKLCEWVSDSE